MRAQRTLSLIVAIGAVTGATICAQTPRAQADVVLVVDNSLSIKQPGFDPERTSLLVTRLFSDIVPGGLAVIRVLDLKRDAELLPSKRSGKQTPCQDSGATCEQVTQATDWVQAVRSNPLRAGLLPRPSRGDAHYKDDLERHLQQTSNNSLFGLSFETADAYFQRPGAPAGPRVLIWLSDGEPEDLPTMQSAIAHLGDHGVITRAIIFGKGRTHYSRSLGLQHKVAHNPAELMSAFADIFREVVDAPYRLDGLVSSNSRV